MESKQANLSHSEDIIVFHLFEAMVDKVLHSCTRNFSVDDGPQIHHKLGNK